MQYPFIQIANSFLNLKFIKVFVRTFVRDIVLLFILECPVQF